MDMTLQVLCANNNDGLMYRCMEKIFEYLLTDERPMEILKLLGTAIIAYFTLTLSLKKFFKEKRWERKFEAYSKIIEALHHLKATNIYWENESWDDVAYNEEKSTKVYNRFRAAQDELDKYVDVGSFYISAKAIDALNELKKVQQECKNEWDETDPFQPELYRREGIAISKCLDAVKAIADKEINKPN